ncbi:hypothetical protein X943_003462 [Babesia divergens]|uniref:Uncharacterized protein n=1 Tax=Babesia divergens TaxID=32595 RepID=A0AAD9GJX0_BABDI|nr:hypothetical protein X943_003462 [Babesia divergens]
MPIKIKALGYTLKPGERFTDDEDLPDSLELEDSGDAISRSEIAINKESEILDKIEEIIPRRDGKKLPWIETLDITAAQRCRNEFDRNETLKIEEHFKEIASDCVRKGLHKLTKLGIPFNRPSDFYADMLKTDIQMARVMKKLTNRSKFIQEKKKQQQVKVKKGIDKQVRQRQRKNKFIKDVNNLLTNRTGNQPVERQLDKLIDTHSKIEHKKKPEPGTSKSRKKVMHSTNKSSRKPQKSKLNDRKKPKGKSAKRGKGSSGKGKRGQGKR